jgi:hypothetical protein
MLREKIKIIKIKLRKNEKNKRSAIEFFSPNHHFLFDYLFSFLDNRV